METLYGIVRRCLRGFSWAALQRQSREEAVAAESALLVFFNAGGGVGGGETSWQCVRAC